MSVQKLPQLKEWEAVEVEWVDSAGDEGGWTTVTKGTTEIHGTITVGQVYEQWDDRIAIVLSRDSTNNMVCGIITIPLVAVTAFRRLAGQEND